VTAQYSSINWSRSNDDALGEHEVQETQLALARIAALTCGREVFDYVPARRIDVIETVGRRPAVRSTDPP
jgi:hypothetical protein